MVYSELFIAIAVILLNAIPAFMPPTWVLLAYLHVTQGGDILQLALVGAICSTIGRIILAKWSGPLVSGIMPKPMKHNVEYAKKVVSHKPFASFAFSFLYALSPFPSNAVFIIAGVAGLGLIPIAAGFFLGRLISYYLLMLAAGYTAKAIGLHLLMSEGNRWILDLLGIASAVVFLFVDWKSLLHSFGKRKKAK